jgi:replication-associated recombination protein RarA
MSYITTRNGYDFFVASSSLQKAIRRNRPDIAGYFALELYHSGYGKYVWKRLLTISAEDCYGIITQEIESLCRSFLFINEDKSDLSKGRIFISKAVLILCAHPKCRDADHLSNYVYDQNKISDAEVQKLIESLQKDIEKNGLKRVPDYAYDCHTSEGKKRGKTKKDFFETELEALRPRQVGLFDNLIS